MWCLLTLAFDFVLLCTDFTTLIFPLSTPNFCLAHPNIERGTPSLFPCKQNLCFFFFGSSIFLATVVAWRWHEQHHGLQKHYIASHLLTSADEWRYWGCVQGSNSSFNIFLQCDCQALSFSFTVNGSFLSSLKIHFSPSLFYLDLIYFMSLTERYGSYNCCCQCLQIRLFEPCVLLLSFVDFSSAASRSPVLLSPAYL